MNKACYSTYFARHSINKPTQLLDSHLTKYGNTIPTKSIVIEQRRNNKYRTRLLNIVPR